MNVCVFGLWHLGCVTAASLAELGFDVIGLDFDTNIIADLDKGTAPLHEPELDDLIKKGLASGKLSFTSNSKTALENAEFVWVAFDTPVDEHDVADIPFLERNMLSIMEHINDGTKIIISSQAPVGFVRKLENTAKKEYPDKKLFFACSPENLRLGKALKVFNNPDRIIIGVRDAKDTLEFTPLFSKITPKLEWMSTESAEMTKHAINSFLALSVVFANELGTICESVGADAKEVERGLKTEERIGPKAYVSPGLSFAGGTLARDVNFLIAKAAENNKKALLMQAIKDSNDHHKGWVKNKCIELFKDLKGKNFAILGLAYKPGTSTLRRSSAVDLCKWLHDNGAKVKAYDPLVTSLPEDLSKIVELKNDISSTVEGSECVIIANDNPLFKSMDEKTKEKIGGRVLIDPTSFLRSIFIDNKDIVYIAVGRGIKIEE